MIVQSIYFSLIAISTEHLSWFPKLPLLHHWWDMGISWPYIWLCFLCKKLRNALFHLMITMKYGIDHSVGIDQPLWHWSCLFPQELWYYCDLITSTIHHPELLLKKKASWIYQARELSAQVPGRRVFFLLAIITSFVQRVFSPILNQWVGVDANNAWTMSCYDNVHSWLVLIT